MPGIVNNLLTVKRRDLSPTYNTSGLWPWGRAGLERDCGSCLTGPRDGPYRSEAAGGVKESAGESAQLQAGWFFWR